MTARPVLALLIDARLGLGAIFERRGLFDEAAACYLANLQAGSQDPVVCERLAAVYVETPANPTLRMTDLRAVVAATLDEAHDAITAIMEDKIHGAAGASVCSAATGTVSVASGTPNGAPTLTYQIREIANPANCAQATSAARRGCSASRRN